MSEGATTTSLGGLSIQLQRRGAREKKKYIPSQKHFLLNGPRIVALSVLPALGILAGAASAIARGLQPLSP